MLFGVLILLLERKRKKKKKKTCFLIFFFSFFRAAVWCCCCWSARAFSQTAKVELLRISQLPYPFYQPPPPNNLLLYYYTHLPPHSFFSHPQKSSSISSQQSPIIKAGPARPCVYVSALSLFHPTHLPHTFIDREYSLGAAELDRVYYT